MMDFVGHTWAQLQKNTMDEKAMAFNRQICYKQIGVCSVSILYNGTSVLLIENNSP